MSLLNLAQSALDLLYPRQCQICWGTKRCEYFPFICDDCFTGAPRIQPPCCELCGLPFSGEITSSFQCPNCTQTKLHFDRAISVMRFRGAVRDAIHRLKYSRQLYWGDALQHWLLQGADSLLDQAQVDVALPVPLHPLRERERGCNQAWVLLETLAQNKKIPCNKHALVRIRQTETQTHLDRQERIENLKDAFEVRKPEWVANKRILLVDDVLTTGSTTSECSRVLRHAGAISVLVFTLARG